jgi:hypothetical protein
MRHSRPDSVEFVAHGNTLDQMAADAKGLV